MLAFIDESGCPGFKLARSSDAVFALGMVIIENRADALRTAAAIAQFRARRGFSSELKFSKSSDAVRDGFFESVRHCPFKFCALIVKKTEVTSPKLSGTREDFYGVFMSELMRRASNRLNDVKLFVDGSGSVFFQQEMKRRLRRDLTGRLTDLKFVDSRRDDFIQLADMCVGAVARAFRSPGDGERWLTLLQPRIDEIWQFR
jgi:hypothetical protein